jgi:hypothetical protein
MQIVRELDMVTIVTDRFPKRRVVILLREDGWYAFAEQYYFASLHNEEIVAEGWRTLPARGFYASSAIAETEAMAAFPGWYAAT